MTEEQEVKLTQQKEHQLQDKTLIRFQIRAKANSTDRSNKNLHNKTTTNQNKRLIKQNTT